MSLAIADTLFQHLIAAFPPDRPYTRADFEREPMPALMAYFLAQTLQRRFDLEVEQLRAVRSNWFDYDHPEVQETHKVLIVALLQHARIPREEWTRTLEQTVQRVMAYLVRPVPTLVGFIFNEASEPLPAHVIYRRLGYFAAYPYLRTAVEAYFERKDETEIDRSRFSRLLQRVDRQIHAGYTAGQWLQLMAPLFEIAAYLTPSGNLPASVLRTFFEEKEAASALYQIDEAVARGVKGFSEETLRELFDYIPSSAAGAEADLFDPAMPESIPNASPISASPVSSLPGSPAPVPEVPIAEPPNSGEEDASVPLWKRYMNDAPAPLSHDVQTQDEPETRPLWMQYHSGTEAPTSDLTSLEVSILGDQTNRDRFVQNLFSGSAEEYERVLRRLHTAPTWTQASQIIAQDVFKTHQVNIYSPPAIAFTNAVEARYRQGA